MTSRKYGSGNAVYPPPFSNVTNDSQTGVILNVSIVSMSEAAGVSAYCDGHTWHFCDAIDKTVYAHDVDTNVFSCVGHKKYCTDLAGGIQQPMSLNDDLTPFKHGGWLTPEQVTMLSPLLGFLSVGYRWIRKQIYSFNRHRMSLNGVI